MLHTRDVQHGNISPLGVIQDGRRRHEAASRRSLGVSGAEKAATFRHGFFALILG